jgi:3-dehydroquinate synthase
LFLQHFSAQVDSALGGKTAINHEKGKNLIGVFHQPSLVACDYALLNTLPDRDVYSGLGEMLKYALTFDRVFVLAFEKANFKG